MKNKYLGKLIQVTNSPQYIALQNKYDNLYELDSDLLNSNVTNTSIMLANGICDKDEVEFLSVVSGLGSIDGGDIALQRINNTIPDDSKLQKEEFVEANLKKIFPKENDEFFKEIMESIKAIFRGTDFPTNESKVVAYAYALELLANYMSKNKNWDVDQATGFIFNEIQKLKQQFKETGTFEFDGKTKQAIFSIRNYGEVSAKYYEAGDDLKDLLGMYHASKITRAELIDELYNYNSKKKVKG